MSGWRDGGEQVALLVHLRYHTLEVSTAVVGDLTHLLSLRVDLLLDVLIESILSALGWR